MSREIDEKGNLIDEPTPQATSGLNDGLGENGSAYRFTNSTSQPMWSCPMKHVYHINDEQLERDMKVLRDRIGYLKEKTDGKGYHGREIGVLIRVLNFLGEHAA